MAGAKSKYSMDSKNKNNMITKSSGSQPAKAPSLKLASFQQSNTSTTTHSSSFSSSSSKYESSIAKTETAKKASIWNPSSTTSSTSSFRTSSTHNQQQRTTSTSSSTGTTDVFKTNPFAAMTNYGNSNGVSSINKNAIDAVSYNTTHYKSPFLPNSSTTMNSSNRYVEGSKYLVPSSSTYKSPIVNRPYNASEKLPYDPKTNPASYKLGTANTNNIGKVAALGTLLATTSNSTPASSYKLLTSPSPVKVSTVTSPTNKYT